MIRCSRLVRLIPLLLIALDHTPAIAQTSFSSAPVTGIHVVQSGPALESKHVALIEAFAARFGLPGFSKEEGQAWIARLAGTFAARFPNEGWGTKRASESRPLSNESIARPSGGRLWSYDLIIGAGAAGQRLEPRAHAEDISDQVFVSVQPFDFLGGGGTTNPPPDTGGPPPVQPPPANNAEVSAILAELRAIREERTNQMTALIGLVSAITRVQELLEEVKNHDLVSANEQRVTRAEIVAALERLRTSTLKVRVNF